MPTAGNLRQRKHDHHRRRPSTQRGAKTGRDEKFSRRPKTNLLQTLLPKIASRDEVFLRNGHSALPIQTPKPPEISDEYPARRSRAEHSGNRRFAFAARTASVLVGCFVGSGAFMAFPAVGILGNACVGMIAPRLTGWVLMGPVGGGLLLGMTRQLVPAWFVRSRIPGCSEHGTFPAVTGYQAFRSLTGRSKCGI